MITAKDEGLAVYIGLAFSVPYDFKNDDNSSVDLNGISATAKMRNIDEEFKEEGIHENFGTVIIEPENEKGRILLNLSEEDTEKFKIPKDEAQPYTVSNIYSKIYIIDQEGKPLLDISVKPIKV